MTRTKRVRIHTFGCQMNVYDSERMVELLAPLGYVQTDRDEDADLILINTCSVREKPEQKVLSLVGRLSPLKARRPGLLLGVAGCVGRQHGEELLARAPALDLVLGPDRVGEIAALVAEAEATGRPRVAVEDEEDPGRLFARGVPGGAAPSRFVSVMKGCDQHCAYCIVPSVRGSEVSRAPEDVLAECRALLDAGACELILLGQNVNRYGMGDRGLPDFPTLLRRAHGLPGLRRLSFVTSNPGDCPPALVRCFAELPKLSPYFHLPMQSGSDRVLARMNRRYDRGRYLALVHQLREARPGIHLSTDLIVGFPGETPEDFQATLDAAAEVRWGSAFSFMYDPRPGTRAAGWPDDVPPAEKARRLAVLQEVLHRTMMEALEAHVGRVVEVLVEGPSRRGDGQLSGRSVTNYVVNFPGDGALAGSLVSVRVEKAARHSLLGVPVKGGA
ncbi:MAG: tRNA (N6-isopentenyl adenosine(37)-C2)-methylthiotransferase MiaB [Deltaproteobacteria bacterium]|nr:tRNA (N6-isopentenyl adenosine(37)-C2)-methylthiotransferase MiaB [Deltaproteobacteria bacterium]